MVPATEPPPVHPTGPGLRRSVESAPLASSGVRHAATGSTGSPYGWMECADATVWLCRSQPLCSTRWRGRRRVSRSNGTGPTCRSTGRPLPARGSLLPGVHERPRAARGARRRRARAGKGRGGTTTQVPVPTAAALTAYAATVTLEAARGDAFFGARINREEVDPATPLTRRIFSANDRATDCG